MARERREAIFCGEGGGEDCSWVRVVVNSVMDMLGGAEGGCGMLWKCFGCVLLNLADTVERERMERSAVIAGRKTARSEAERRPVHVIITGSKSVIVTPYAGTDFFFIFFIFLTSSMLR